MRVIHIVLAVALLALATTAMAAPWEEQKWDQALQLQDKARYGEAKAIWSELIDSGLLTRLAMAMAHVNRGLAWRGLGNPGQARQDYQQALQLSPSLASALFLKANLDMEESNLREALTGYSAVLKLQPDNIAALLRLSQAHLRLDMPEAALADYNRILSLQPDNVQALMGRGILLASRAEFGKARKDLERATRLNPGSALAWSALAQAQANTQDLDAAVLSYDKALKIDENADDYYMRGKVKDKLGRLDEALADFDRALKLDPQDPAPLLARGNAYYRAGKWQKAIAEYDRALQESPSLAAALLNRAAAKSKLEDLDGALADYDQALQLDAKLALAYHNRALIWERKGKMERAEADFKKALELSPDFKSARDHLQRLQK